MILPATPGGYGSNAAGSAERRSAAIWNKCSTDDVLIRAMHPSGSLKIIKKRGKELIARDMSNDSRGKRLIARSASG
jgi:hypothetical protein